MDYKELEDYFYHLDRSFFMDSHLKEYAIHDRPLPIGYGQTISQPSLVLEMTCLLEPQSDSKVLEIGTGSGYQTALLARISKEVYTVERIKELSQSAKEKLDQLGFTNIYYKIGDGSDGWSAYAPFDRIMVTAAAGKIPVELIQQLSNRGRMIIPVGPEGLQELKLIMKERDGKIKIKNLGMVFFVEMKGKYGWS